MERLHLGLVIVPHLKWNYHTDILAAKLSRSIGMLSKIRYYIPENTQCRIYRMRGIF